MKFLLSSLLIVIILIVVNAAPKTDKSDKKCPQCRVKGKDKYSPVCGILNGVKGTFDSENVFYCFAKCRKVSNTLLYRESCRPDNASQTSTKSPTTSSTGGIIFDKTSTDHPLDIPIDVRSPSKQ